MFPVLYILFLNVTKPGAGIVKESYKVDDLTVFVDLYNYLKQTLGFVVISMPFCSYNVS
jgi:hypothetical protein